MSLFGMLLRTGARQRWRSWLALTLLVALVVGFVLAGAQTARRTATAWPRFEAVHGFDVFAYAPIPIRDPAALPGVATVVRIRGPAAGPPACDSCTTQINDNDFSMQEVAPAQLTSLVKLVSGHMPDQSDPHQVLASESLAPLGVHVGTVLRAPTGHVGAACRSVGQRDHHTPRADRHLARGRHVDLRVRVPFQLHAVL